MWLLNHAASRIMPNLLIPLIGGLVIGLAVYLFRSRFFSRWWKARVRGFGPGRRSPLGWYVRITPSLGFAIPWTRGRRLRWARHHGLQLVELRVERWVVARQLAGRSTVKGEVYKRKLPPSSAANISSIT